ncbi:MAG TPA: mercuric transport protein MerTP [Flavisolibacter sp.]|jgi:copper chaperone CopZ|nr:mercuric transport protein MerTP [Flavisolibacter sp.]
MTTTTKNSKNIIVGLLTATAASLCCITPVLAFLGGTSGLASSFSWIEPFRPFLVGLTVVVFAFAWYQKLKGQKQTDCNCETNNKKSFLHSSAFLGIVTVVAGLLIAFPYYEAAFYPKNKQTQVVISTNADIKQAEFKIKGMSCEGCTEHVNSEIAKVKGVINYQTSFKKANSMVKFDNSKTSVDSIVAAINSTGYKVTSQKISN